MINTVFIFDPVRTEYIHRCLETLYKYTDMKDNRVIVVDQTLKGLQLPMDKVHLHIRPHRNLGFAKSMNEGIIHGLHWQAKYIACCNDDVELINKSWWDGIIETFNMSERIVAVNPMSIREPGWGYGLEHGVYLDLMPYKEEYTGKDYYYLLKGDFSGIEGLPDTFPKQKNGVIDAIATWFTVFRSDVFAKIGMFDELYFPGGGEDYDINARAYRQDLRMVGTTKSWVWHFWGQSKDKQGELSEGLPIKDELRWANPDYLWKPEWNNGQIMDPWGKWTDDKGTKRPMKRVDTIHVVDI